MARSRSQAFREVPPVPGPSVGVRSDYSVSDPLRASDTLVHQQFGQTSGEGHFGTGVYFVSVPDRTRGVRGHLRGIDLTGANMWKPVDEAEAFRVHDALLEADDLAAHGDFEANVGQLVKRTVNPETIAGDLPAGASAEIVRAAIAATISDLKDRNLDADTAGTRIMRALGYDGVDVRHLDERVDNTAYGSVLYRPARAG